MPRWTLISVKARERSAGLEVQALCSVNGRDTARSNEQRRGISGELSVPVGLGLSTLVVF